MNGEKSTSQAENVENDHRKVSRSISVNSFYSVNSSRSEGDKDYYSVCSAESFKSV